MANVLIIGGGFSGVVAAERLAKTLGDDHQVTLVSRESNFVFYPHLVQVAFGKTEPSAASFDLRQSMLERHVRFIKGEVARVLPQSRQVVMTHGDVEGALSYDYLIFALGRRLATEEITGYFEHANHLLSVEAALDFGNAIKSFKGGRAIFGQCLGARLPIPVYEAAFAFARMLDERGQRDRAVITIVSPDQPGYQMGDLRIAHALRSALDKHLIEYLPDFSVAKVTAEELVSTSGESINHQLLMLVPPFRGSGVARTLGAFANEEGYLNVDWSMRVIGCDRVYAAGDCVNFRGPKMAHMAVHQAEVAAANIELEIRGLEPSVAYNHEIMMVIDEGGTESIFVKQNLDQPELSTVKTGYFWSWAKWVHDKYWQAQHS